MSTVAVKIWRYIDWAVPTINWLGDDSIRSTRTHPMKQHRNCKSSKHDFFCDWGNNQVPPQHWISPRIKAVQEFFIIQNIICPLCCRTKKEDSSDKEWPNPAQKHRLCTQTNLMTEWCEILHRAKAINLKCCFLCTLEVLVDGEHASFPSQKYSKIWLISLDKRFQSRAFSFFFFFGVLYRETTGFAWARFYHLAAYGTTGRGPERALAWSRLRCHVRLQA